MGFFKKLFKRKKGGTLFGNLIRKVSSKATGGVLGSGSGLKRWEAEQAQKEQNQAISNAVAQATAGMKKTSSFQKIGDDVMKDIEKEKKKEWLKKNWWMIAIPAVVMIGLVFALFRKDKKGNNRKR